MTSSTQGIDDFWSWWQGYADTAAALLRSQDIDTFARELSPRIDQIHPDLGWETAPPENAEFCLVVSAGGVAENRSIAERWLRSAPAADDRWEFRSARPANPRMLGVPLRLDDHEFDLSHVEFAVRFSARRARFDLSAYHPDFAFVDETLARQAAFLTLDFALGEDDVARWIGAVQIATEKPTDSFPATGLRPVVTDIAGNYAEPAWLTLGGRTADGQDLQVVTRFPMRRVDFPLFDEHIAVGLPYVHKTADGFPTGESAAALDRLTAALTELAGTDAAVVARQSAGGVHVVHLYADTEQDVASRLKPVIEEWSEGEAGMQAVHDPGWKGVEALRT
ncbi:MAG TPA: DUF695 domain-containing protein [Actinopolymorphaceae bacterium]